MNGLLSCLYNYPKMCPVCIIKGSGLKYKVYMNDMKEEKHPGLKISSSTPPLTHTNSQLGELTRDLHERVKELNCLYEISRLVENMGLSIDEFLQFVINIVPPAWQFPEITCARIKLKDQEFLTENFKKTKYVQSQTILVDGQSFGSIEVYYLKATRLFDEGPFLKEERNLLNVIAERIGHNIEHKSAVTRVKLLYQREKELREKLQKEIGVRADFTRKLIHELKTPLTSLIATSNLLYDETKGEKLGKLAQYVLNSANNLNNRIDELHDVIKGEIGTLKIKPNKFSMGKLLHAIVEETMALSMECGVSIDLKLGDNLPEVYADKERVRQVLLNLINNACHYARSGKRITISAVTRADVVQIEVKDYGPGIPEDRQGSLFESGYQLAYHNERSGGLGIGLVLCKTLIELHGGKMWLKSQDGEGAAFLFTLPVQ
jgi:signal transduction histidine kinase